MQLTVVLPIHNEKESIENVVQEWLSLLCSQNISFEVLLCEDGSTDGTQEIIQILSQRNPEVRLDSVDYRRGYGKAVVDGYLKANGDYVLVSDSDGQINPASFKDLWAKRDAADIIIGARTPRLDPLARKIYSFFFRWYFSCFFKSPLRDPSCPFVLIKKEKVGPMLPLLKFMIEGFWWGFVAAGIKKHYTFCEINIEHRARFAGVTRVYHLKKMPKIIWRNGLGLIRLRFANLYP